MSHVTRSDYAGGIQSAKRLRPAVRSSAHLPAGETPKLCKKMWSCIRDYRKASDQPDKIRALNPLRKLSQQGGLLPRALRGDHVSIRHADLIHSLCVQASSEAIVGANIDDNGKGLNYVTEHGTPAIDRLADAILDLREVYQRQTYWQRNGGW